MRNLLPLFSRICRTLCLVAVLFTLSACTSFRGPEELELPEFTGPGTEEVERAREELKSGDIAFDWPVDSAKLSQQFRSGAGSRNHWGIDLAGPRGTPIIAAEKGYVIYTGREFRGYGNLVVIEHSPEWATLYSHLDRILVKEGQFVRQGELIGKMGKTGRASGVHLHFEIRHNRQPVNPEAYLPRGM